MGVRSANLEFTQSELPLAGLQTIDIGSDENKTFLQYHKYPTTEGLTWKSGTNRITAHTDESLITLLYPSPGPLPL